MGHCYVATVNVPGYLPMDDDPPVFDTAKEAWEYLWNEFLNAWSYPIGFNDGFDKGKNALGAMIDTPEIGTVYTVTPGYDGSHDLGLAYSVNQTEECEHLADSDG